MKPTGTLTPRPKKGGNKFHGGGGGRAGNVRHWKRPKPELKKPKDSPEHDNDLADDADDLEFDSPETGILDVDASEISAFVSKLGLDKFNLNQEDVHSLEIKPGEKQNKIDKSAKAELKSKAVPVPVEQQESLPTKLSNVSVTVKKKREKKKQIQGKDGTSIANKKDTPQKKHKLIMTSGGKWFIKDQTAKMERNTEGEDLKYLTPSKVAEIKKSAEDLLEKDIQAYKLVNIRGSNKSDFQWMEKIMKNGTLPDRMAAFIVRIQDSPIHNLNYLQNLIGMVKVQGKQQCMMTADTVRDLFLEDLLPPNRKLIAFIDRGSQLHKATKPELIEYIFEERLKNNYNTYIDALKRMASDTVEKLRGKAISIIYQLLVAHPEQEAVLLQVLVNKLGDPAKKLGSRALFYLKRLLDEHPKMKRVVIEEVERLLFRNNIARKAQYYGICFLNLIPLENEHASLAHKLINVHLAFFKASVKTGDIDTKMMSGLLTGINKAFPQAREFGFNFTENLDTLYKIVQLSQFTIAVQALCILFQVTDVERNPTGADRFYRVLYGKLLSPEFLSTSPNMQFINLIFRAMKADDNHDRLLGFGKRLLQICLNVPANLACSILLTLSEVSKTHSAIIRMGERSKDEKDAEANHASILVSDSDSDSEGDGNKNKSNNNSKLKAWMKSTNVRIVEDQIPNYVSTNSTTISSSSTINEESILELPNESIPDESAILITNKNDGTDEKPLLKPAVTQYDATARNPRYCGADHTLAYEIAGLSNHFHPSVALFAQTLADGRCISYQGNPLKDFTLGRFLERFVYRNAKVKKDHAEYQPKGLRNVPVNSDNYLMADEEKIPVDELFFYKYFKKAKEEKHADKEDEDDESDADSIDDDEFDGLMKNYFKSTTPDGDDDDDSEEDEETEEIDFASVVPKEGKSKKRKRALEDLEDDEEESDADSLEENEDADDFVDLDGDMEEEMEDYDEDIDMFEDGDEIFAPKKGKLARKHSKRFGETDMFASADQFAELLEANAEENLTGSQTLINKDKADPKQLKWEVEKDRMVKGFTGSSSKYKHKKGNMKKKFKKR